MSISDRIYLFLAEGTPDYNQLIGLVGNPTSSIGSAVLTPAEEYIEGIDLESVATPFQARLSVYGNQPISTFSILA